MRFKKKLWGEAGVNKQTKQNTVILKKEKKERKKSSIPYYSCFLEMPTVVQASKEVLDLTIRKGKQEAKTRTVTSISITLWSPSAAVGRPRGPLWSSTLSCLRMCFLSGSCSH